MKELQSINDVLINNELFLGTSFPQTTLRNPGDKISCNIFIMCCIFSGIGYFHENPNS